MRIPVWRACCACVSGLVVALSGCGGGGSATITQPPSSFTLTVNSTNPATGVAIKVVPLDSNGSGNGNSSFTRLYAAGATVTLTAPATAGSSKFSAWQGCTTASTETCSVTVNANATVTAGFTASPVTGVSVTPNPAPVTIGATQQFTAAVTGTGTFDNTVTWSVQAPSGSTLSAGTITSGGLYTTPYPAPATVTVTALSNQDNITAGSVTVTLTPPATASGPALTVDAANETHAISPYIYGMNAYQLTSSVATASNVPIVRWGGDSTSRYNYLLDVTSSAGDYFFENQPGTGGDGYGSNNPGATAFETLVQNDNAIGAKTLVTAQVMGWVAKDMTSCSYPVATYPNQFAVDANRNCGDGENADQSSITGNDATVTSTAVGPAWAGNWATALVSKFGSAASGGVAIYDLDNEPSWWDGVHRDVHPVASTYDEVTNNGIATAQAIKAADPTAEVSGPVIDYWWNYFYSKKDIESGWGAPSSCYQQWDNPVDRKAHGGVPLIEYYLQQFAKQSPRMLDYLDLHTYFAADNLGFAPAGQTDAQIARLDSTRVFWDPTYTDPNYPQPNYTTDANFTTSCNVPLQAPQLIPMMHSWIAKDYPGTKTAITEYNWGGQESINGALAQADILGIFGREGLDLGTLWGPPQPGTQVPGLMAFEAFRNYDGANSKFGDTALASTSGNQGQLSVYGALRASDNQVTVVVINKTYGDLTDTLSLANLTPNGTAKSYLYSNSNLAAIVPESDLTVTPPSGGGTTSTISATFPAQSITILIIPKM
jgi:hypothetical protein